MTHEMKDLLMAIAAIVGTVAAVAVPMLMYFSMKTSWAETWGKVQQLLQDTREKVSRLESTVDEHSKDIGYLKGKTNSPSLGAHHAS